MEQFLPTSRKELDALGYDNVDVILFSGDAYVDHPSFGPAVIGRVLEHEGYRVAIVPQPNWRDDLRDFTKLGKPRLFFGVTAGNMDSMVNRYTAAKRLRSDDAYTPDGRPDMRPDYTVTVYTTILKRLFPNVPVVLGGIEASLRRLTHYDYWSNSLKPSVLIDSGADYLIYGMGERPIVELAAQLRARTVTPATCSIPQVAVLQSIDAPLPQNALILPSHAKCLASKEQFALHFQQLEKAANVPFPQTLVEENGAVRVVVNPPYPLMTQEQLDAVYELPFTYKAHFRYKNKRIPALDMIQFSVCLHRGCFGGCSFCTIAAHQGRAIAWRSQESVLREVERLSHLENFKGYLTDLGGPSANMYGMRGVRTEVCAKCQRTSCLFPVKCKNLDASHASLSELYRKVRALPYIKKATIGSGIRYDLFLDRDGFLDNQGREYFANLLRYHVSGRLKVAPEHTEDHVLQCMHKPQFALYQTLWREFSKLNEKENLRLQLIPYFISSHPACTLQDMQRLSQKFRQQHLHVEQVQDFTPTPMTKSSVMFWSGINPDTMENVFVERDSRRKNRQKDCFFNT